MAMHAAIGSASLLIARTAPSPVGSSILEKAGGCHGSGSSCPCRHPVVRLAILLSAGFSASLHETIPDTVPAVDSTGTPGKDSFWSTEAGLIVRGA